MPRSYRNIQMYEEEILKLNNERLTQKEISKKIGSTKKQF